MVEVVVGLTWEIAMVLQATVEITTIVVEKVVVWMSAAATLVADSVVEAEVEVG